MTEQDHNSNFMKHDRRREYILLMEGKNQQKKKRNVHHILIQQISGVDSNKLN